jgi:hypothetical protein
MNWTPGSRNWVATKLALNLTRSGNLPLIFLVIRVQRVFLGGQLAGMFEQLGVRGEFLPGHREALADDLPPGHFPFGALDCRSGGAD